MMRQHTSHIVFVLAFACVSSVAFAKSTTQHGVGGYLLGGYHTELLPKNSQLKSPNGWEAGLGFDYRLTARPASKARKTSAKFLFNTGLGLSLRQFTFAANPSDIKMPNSVDSDGYKFTFVYQLSDRKDQYTRLGAVLPLMFGAEFKRFYFTLGAKVNLAFWAQANTTLKVSSYGDYPQFLDPFSSMPEHQFFDAREVKKKQTVSLSSDVLASAEIGCLLSRFNEKSLYDKPHPEVRLALFADYGVFSFGQAMATTNPAIQTPAVFSDKQDMFTPIKVNHALSTTLVGDGRVVPLTAGVRLIISMPYSKSSYPCHCERDNFTVRRRK